MKLTKILMLGLLGLTALLSSCASVTKQASNVYPDPRPDKGLVYFYRESHLMGWAISYNVRENGKVIGAIANGTYFYVFANPGKHTYTASTEADSSRTLSVEGGKTYYIECGVEMGAFAGRPTLKIANEDEGKSVLQTVHYAIK